MKSMKLPPLQWQENPEKNKMDNKGLSVFMASGEMMGMWC
jgi:hypothetical protein